MRGMSKCANGATISTRAPASSRVSRAAPSAQGEELARVGPLPSSSLSRPPAPTRRPFAPPGRRLNCPHPPRIRNPSRCLWTHTHTLPIVTPVPPHDPPSPDQHPTPTLTSNAPAELSWSSMYPAGRVHSPCCGSMPRLQRRICPWCSTMHPTTFRGFS